MDKILKQLPMEEDELQFTRFNEDTVWQIGSNLVTHSVTEHIPITIDITRADQQIFHASRPGTSADHVEWIKRKVRLVYRLGHSSYFIGQLLKGRGRRLEDAYFRSESLYAPHGGCFPVILKGAGVIGAITVSGLAQEDIIN